MKKSTLVFIMGLILASPVAIFARWGNSCWSDGYMPGRGGWFGYGFFHGGIFMFAGTLLITGFAAYFGYQYFRTRKVAGLTPGNPADILKMRYVKGEISKEDFDRMKEDIR